MINIAICDDSLEDADEIRKIIINALYKRKYEYEIDLYSCGENLLSNWKSFHIVFLDIEMNGKNGIDIGNIIKTCYIKTKIIYVTSYNSYYIDAFAVHAFQYIIKPIIECQIRKVLYEAIKQIHSMVLLNTVILDINGEVINLDIQNIYYFEFINRKVKAVSVDNIIYIKTSLKYIYEKIYDYDFRMPHKAFIVNFLMIKRIKNNELILLNNESIPIAQKRASKLKKDYYHFLNSLYNVL